MRTENEIIRIDCKCGVVIALTPQEPLDSLFEFICPNCGEVHLVNSTSEPVGTEDDFYTQMVQAREREEIALQANNDANIEIARLTKLVQQITMAVNACCTCGGGGPGEKHTCPACEVYHALITVPNNKVRDNDPETQTPQPVDSIVWWEISHPGTFEKVKCATFHEALDKWFEGFNIPVLVVDGVREEFSKACDRVKRHYASPNNKVRDTDR